MELIEPYHFDAVVITSGLPEVLIASALARAGKSILVLDATESYGASWSSLSGQDFVHCMVNRHLEQQQLQPQQGQHDNGVADASHAAQQAATCVADQAATDAEQCQAADDREAQQSLIEVELQTVRPFSSLHGSVALYTHPQVEAALANKQLLIDLAPKVLYQDEALVQLLVSCQAHNYLEFKLVEGSYIYQAGCLRPVPASRADLFADKSLSLADKRSLGRFLTACMEAQRGFGRLKDCFDSRPLVELLRSEGLSKTLQQVVLYGIAMADTPQEQHHQQQQQVVPVPATEAAVGTSCKCATTSWGSPSSALLTAAEGLAALQLYTASLGRYGGTGAFMAPCYGCGSLPEAFVRLAAVKGAVTALRHGARKLLLPPVKTPKQQQQQQQQETSMVPASISSGSAAEGNASAPPGDSQTIEAAAAAAATARIVLMSGQTITAGTVVGCQEALKHSTTAAAGAAAQALSCCRVVHAVLLLDGSLVDSDNSLVLVVPPGSLGCEQTTVIRGLQCGPALAVTPPGKYLLYLSAVLPQNHSSSNSNSSCNSSISSNKCDKWVGMCTAEQVLGPAAQVLVSIQGLEAFRFGEDVAADTENVVQPEQQGQVHKGSSDSAAAEGRAFCADQEPQRPRRQPQALAVCYYTTQHAAQPCGVCQQQQQQQGGTDVLWCPPASAGHTGYDGVVTATEAAYRQQFPDLPWLTDELRLKGSQHRVLLTAAAGAGVPTSQDTGSASEAAGSDVPQAAAHHAPGGGGQDTEDDNEAIDELTAALAELSALE